MSEAIQIKPFNSYLVRAADAWLRENGLTPFICVDVEWPGVQVPSEAKVQDGKVVLNISMISTSSLSMGEEGYSFRARFDSKVHDLFIPYCAILSMWARESPENAFIALPVLEPEITKRAVADVQSKISTPSEELCAQTLPTKVPHLRVVK